jgi:hypothetical protein
MASSAAEIPAGRAIGPTPKMGDRKATSLEPLPMLRGGSKDQGGGTSPKGQTVPKEVHTPEEPQGREQAVPVTLNPNKEKTRSAHLDETQFWVGCWFGPHGCVLLFVLLLFPVLFG